MSLQNSKISSKSAKFKKLITFYILRFRSLQHIHMQPFNSYNEFVKLIKKLKEYRHHINTKILPLSQHLMS